jgi:hypothetical protein
MSQPGVSGARSHLPTAIAMTITARHGAELLDDPLAQQVYRLHGRGKTGAGLVGLVRAVTATEDLQLHRVIAPFAKKDTDLDRRGLSRLRR